MAFIRQPHTLKVTRPEPVQDDDTNIGKLDETGVKPFTIKGMFQERPGDQVQTREGAVVTFDAVLYTANTNVRVNDVIEPQGIPTTERFTVRDTERKYAVNGRFTHLQCTLSLENKRVVE
jgi:hypothetical protein